MNGNNRINNFSRRSVPEEQYGAYANRNVQDEPLDFSTSANRNVQDEPLDLSTPASQSNSLSQWQTPLFSRNVAQETYRASGSIPQPILYPTHITQHPNSAFYPPSKKRRFGQAPATKDMILTNLDNRDIQYRVASMPGTSRGVQTTPVAGTKRAKASTSRPPMTGEEFLEKLTNLLLDEHTTQNIDNDIKNLLKAKHDNMEFTNETCRTYLIKKEGGYRRTILHLLLAKPHISKDNVLQLCKILIAIDGVNINALDKDGNTPLMLAAKHQNSLVLQEILDNNNINTENKLHETALIWAIKGQNAETLNTLLSHPNINLELQDSTGKETKLQRKLRSERTSACMRNRVCAEIEKRKHLSS